MFQLIPEEILKYIVCFLYSDIDNIQEPLVPNFDLQSIACLMNCNKFCLKTIRNDNKLWLEYYRSLSPYWKIGPNSTHIMKQTYFCCSIGPYPGWDHVHDSVENISCKNISHYKNLEKVNKKPYSQKTELFTICARKKFEKSHKWNKGSERRLKKMYKDFEGLDIKIKRMERRKEYSKKN